MGGKIGEAPADHTESWLGLYGKLPSYGDFVQGGLPEEFVQALDAWLSRAIAGSRDRLGANWKEQYLVAPPWRFGLDAGIASDMSVAGVLIPSTDSVGRCFPLVLAAAGRGDAVAFAYLDDPWFESIEMLASRAVRDNMTKWDLLDALSEKVPAQWPEPWRNTLVHKSPHATIWTGSNPDAGPAAFARDVLAMAAASDKPIGLWWTKGSDHVSPTMLVCQAWPTPELYTAFLSGIWHDALTT